MELFENCELGRTRREMEQPVQSLFNPSHAFQQKKNLFNLKGIEEQRALQS